jgi:hypothetical protein
VLKGPAAATLYGTEAARRHQRHHEKGLRQWNQYAFSVKGGNNWFKDAENRIHYNYCWAATSTRHERRGLDAVQRQRSQNENERGAVVPRQGRAQLRRERGGGTGLFRFFAAGEWNAQRGSTTPTSARSRMPERTSVTERTLRPRNERRLREEQDVDEL